KVGLGFVAERVGLRIDARFGVCEISMFVEEEVHIFGLKVRRHIGALAVESAVAARFGLRHRSRRVKVEVHIRSLKTSGVLPATAVEAAVAASLYVLKLVFGSQIRGDGLCAQVAIGLCYSRGAAK